MMREWMVCLAATVILAAGCGGERETATVQVAPTALVPRVVGVHLVGDGPSSHVSALLRDGDVLWVGTKSGLARFVGASGDSGLQREDLTDGQGRLSGEEIRDLSQGEDRLYAATGLGYAVWRAGRGWTVKEVGPANSVAVHGGTLWIARSSGIEKFSPAGESEKLDLGIQLNQTSAQRVKRLAAFGDGQIVGGTDFGIHLRAPGAADAPGVWRHLYGDYQDLRTGNMVVDERGNCPLAGNFVNDVAVERETGRVLISTDVGLTIFKEDRWTSLTGPHDRYVMRGGKAVRERVQGNVDLPSSRVLAGAMASDEAAWLGLEDGVALVDGPKVQVLTTEDGLPSDEVTALSYDRVQERLFVGTARGLAQVEFRQVSPSAEDE